MCGSKDKVLMIMVGRGNFEMSLGGGGGAAVGGGAGGGGHRADEVVGL
jgi:hypothetical protein